MTGVPVPQYLASLFSRRILRGAGVLGAAGSLLAACGDFVTAYSVAPPPAMNTVPWLRLPEFAEFLASKTQGHLLAGHYLGVLFIPLNVLGLWHIYLALAPAGAAFAVLFLAAGTFLAVVGAAFHGMVGLAVTAVRAGDAMTLSHASAYFEPFAWMLTVCGTLLFVALAVAIWRGRTLFPRRLLWLSPALMQIWLTVAANVLPLEVGVLLLVTGFNLSVFLFFAASTACLWNHEPLDPKP